jgi:hypothetical protein
MGTYGYAAPEYVATGMCPADIYDLIMLPAIDVPLTVRIKTESETHAR